MSVESAPSFESHVFEEFDRTFTEFDDHATAAVPDSPQDRHTSEPKEVTMLAEQIEVDIQAAYDRGFTDGQSVTSALLESELSTFRDKVANIDTMIMDLRDQFAMETDQMSNIAVNVAIAIAEHVLHREITDNSMIAVDQAKKVLANMHGTREVIIRVHPDSYEMMKECNSQLLNSTSTLRKIDIHADESVERGGCVLETSMGTVDTQFRHQLEHLRKTMEETVQVKELAGEF